MYINGINIDTFRRIVYVNGKKYPFIKGMKGFNFCIAKNIIYIDGYELKDNTWKKTLKAFIYKILN